MEIAIYSEVILALMPKSPSASYKHPEGSVSSVVALDVDLFQDNAESLVVRLRTTHVLGPSKQGGTTISETVQLGTVTFLDPLGWVGKSGSLLLSYLHSMRRGARRNLYHERFACRLDTDANSKNMNYHLSLVEYSSGRGLLVMEPIGRDLGKRVHY